MRFKQFTTDAYPLHLQERALSSDGPHEVPSDC